MTDQPRAAHSDDPLVAPLIAWYLANARDLPWRRAGVAAWGVLVSEIMLQQTPANRVTPYWRAWMERWPRPSDLATATTAEVIQAWGTLGYPKRALRLQQCGSVIARDHDDVVPRSESTLLGLPGIGEYTAAAIAGFAYGQRTVVLDTNIRRVIARAHVGEALPLPHLTKSERDMATSIVPCDPATAVLWNQSTMELGALICQARTADCDACPVRSPCAWLANGRPGDLHADRRRSQPWEGTDRQARGRVMALLREAEGELVPVAAILANSPRQAQTRRAIETLIADGLATQLGEAVRLP
ncbi:MAG: A/G-specific adenine glycosylase [Propionibacteriaceae bacterium]|nr:A/G-specific adenine glycosylase [Propionibacteriaceae bacterium]